MNTVKKKSVRNSAGRVIDPMTGKFLRDIERFQNPPSLKTVYKIESVKCREPHSYRR